MAYNGKWLSDDGKYYDTFTEKATADHAWRTQREEQQAQNELLAKQNELLQEQTEQRNKLEREKLDFEREQEANRLYELELKQEHKEKMRILKLFDNIGLNKEYYDNFIKYLIANTTEYDTLDSIVNQKEEIKSHIDMMKSNIENPKKVMSDYNYWKNQRERLNTMISDDIWYDRKYDELSDCYSTDPKAEKVYDRFTKFVDNPEGLAEEDIDNLSSKFDIQTFKELKRKNKNNTLFFKVSFAIWILSTILIIYGIFADNTDLGVYGLGLWMAMIVIAILKINYTPDYSSMMKEIIRKEIQNDYTKILDEKKVITKWKEIKVRYENQLKELEQTIKKEMEPKWNDFIEFRKKHYNSRFESLLLDLRLKKQVEELGLKWAKINNGNKINDGSIEDYIEYFENLEIS